MKAEELIKGNIYYIKEGSSWALFRFESRKDSDRVESSGSLSNKWNYDDKDLDFKHYTGWWVTGRGLRPATNKEIQWFKEAENGNIIPFSQMKFEEQINNYQIY